MRTKRPDKLKEALAQEIERLGRRVLPLLQREEDTLDLLRPDWDEWHGGERYVLTPIGQVVQEEIVINYDGRRNYIKGSIEFGSFIQRRNKGDLFKVYTVLRGYITDNIPQRGK